MSSVGSSVAPDSFPEASQPSSWLAFVSLLGKNQNGWRAPDR